MIMSLTNEIKIVHPDPNRILHDKNPEEFLELIFRMLKQKYSDSWGDLEIEQMATQLASYSGINLYKTINKHSKYVEEYTGISMIFDLSDIEELDNGMREWGWDV